MLIMKKLSLFFGLTLFLYSHLSYARPEYSARLRTNRCTTCHTSPAGGGHRNLTGKAFGPKSAPLKSFSKQDIFGFDLRVLAYTQFKNIKEKKNGLGIMTSIPSVSIPFHSSKEGDKEWRLVYSQNIGGFGATPAPREAYLRIKLYDDYRAYPQFISVGRFSAPFGLLTDEHRTYVRWQTRTSWNDQEIGMLFSGDWTPALHYDLSIVNGEQTHGAFGNDGILNWGSVLNLRYMSTKLGWIAGLSASAHNIKQCAESIQKCSSALSLYQALSLDGLTNNGLPGLLLTEVVAGYNTNHRLQGTDFVSNSQYLKLLNEKYSIGGRAQWNYNFFPNWSLIAKYDYLTLDVAYWGDAYHRIGAGINHFFNNQVQFQVRYEKAIATPDSESENPEKAGQDIIWALLQIKI